MKSPLDILPSFRKSPFFMMKTALELIMARVEEYDQEHWQLSVREVWILLAATLCEHSQGKIADALDINRNVMVRVVKDMVQRGLIVQVVNPKMKREMLLKATPKGRKIADEIERSRAEITKVSMEPLSKDRIDQIISGAAAIIDNHGRKR